MMKIAHVALWTRDIDAQLAFWQLFQREAGEITSAATGRGFVSVSSAAAGPTLEIMRVPTLLPAPARGRTGWAHRAVAGG